MKAWPCSILILLAVTPFSFAAQSQSAKNILVLHIENAHLPANIAASKAIQEVIGQHPGYQIFEEYMDENRLGADYPSMADALHRRYAKQKMDLVLTFGPQAFTFLRLYGEELWPRTPKVFSGIEARELPAELPPDTTGVAGSFNFSPTIDLALKLQPETRHVFYVGGATPQEMGRKAIAVQDFKSFNGRLDFTYLNSLPLSELLNRLGQLPSQSVVLFTTYFMDASGQAYVSRRVCSLVVASANSPVYGAFDTLLGYGIVGGSIFDIEANVRQAANLGVRILEGEPVSNLPSNRSRQTNIWWIGDS